MTALIISLGLLICGVVWAFMADGRDEDKAEYEMLYNRIQWELNNWPKTVGKRIISHQLVMLNNLPYKNDEKTEVLVDQYFRKYNIEQL